MYSSYSNVNISFSGQHKTTPVPEGCKTITRDDWRYENLMRASRNEPLLAYDEFCRQVEAGLIQI